VYLTYRSLVSALQSPARSIISFFAPVEKLRLNECGGKAWNYAKRFSCGIREVEKLHLRQLSVEIAFHIAFCVRCREPLLSARMAAAMSGSFKAADRRPRVQAPGRRRRTRVHDEAADARRIASRPSGQARIARAALRLTTVLAISRGGRCRKATNEHIASGHYKGPFSPIRAEDSPHF
jgi:hypothetical protein